MMSRVYQVGCRANAWREEDGTVADYMLIAEHVPLETDHGEPVETIEEALSYTEADAEDEVSCGLYGQCPGYEYHLYQWTDEAGHRQTIALALADTDQD